MRTHHISTRDFREPASELARLATIFLLKVFNPAIMTIAALYGVTLAFVAKLGAFLLTIPVPVMGGILIPLFGPITVAGLNTLVRAGEDLMEPRNMAIVAVVAVFAIGGMAFSAEGFTIKGIGLAGISGFVLNLILPAGKKTG